MSIPSFDVGRCVGESSTVSRLRNICVDSMVPMSDQLQLQPVSRAETNCGHTHESWKPIVSGTPSLCAIAMLQWTSSRRDCDARMPMACQLRFMIRLLLTIGSCNVLEQWISRRLLASSSLQRMSCDVRAFSSKGLVKVPKPFRSFCMLANTNIVGAITSSSIESVLHVKTSL